MKMHEMFPSNYVSKEDVGRGLDLKITECRHEDVRNPDSGREESKPVLYFEQLAKPLILNQVNGKAIAALHGEDSDGWTGKWITLFHDETVSFGSRQVGGVRVRDQVPTPHAGRQTVLADSDVPF